MNRLVLIVLAVALAPASASATSVLPLTRAELASRADTIVRGKVGPQKVVRSEKSGRTLTRSQLAVLQTYKGAPRARLEVEQMGGTLDGKTLVVSGNAALSTGEEVVLYLNCEGSERCHVFGLALGKFGVRTEPGGRRVAIRDLKGLVDVQGKPLAQEEPIALADLERELKGVKP